MLGSEFKEIRLSLGLTQKKFGKSLNISQGDICKMELGILKIPAITELMLEEKIEEKTRVISTDKKFSKKLFLKDMLTGNKVVDEIYLNADWINDINGKKIDKKIVDITMQNKKTKTQRIVSKTCYYFIKGQISFRCNPKWIK